MDWKPQPSDPQIFHITHVDNLPSIISSGCLWSDAQRIRQGFASTNIGYSHIKERRLNHTVAVAAKGKLGDYVPFNFCPRSVMLFVVGRGHEGYSGGEDGVIHLVSSVGRARITGRPWCFTDRHADLGYAIYYEDLGQLQEVEWSAMPRTQWGGDEELKQKRQAEFLVHDHFPWQAVEEVVTKTDAVRLKVLGLLQRTTHRPPVVVRRDWYY